MKRQCVYCVRHKPEGRLMSHQFRIAVLTILIAVSVRADDIAAPPTVTIHMDSMHPREVLAEFTKQTSAGFQIWPDNLYEQERGPNNPIPKSIDVNVDNATF